MRTVKVQTVESTEDLAYKAYYASSSAEIEIYKLHDDRLIWVQSDIYDFPKLPEGYTSSLNADGIAYAFDIYPNVDLGGTIEDFFEALDQMPEYQLVED